jgi:hypothetical protein
MNPVAALSDLGSIMRDFCILAGLGLAAFVFTVPAEAVSMQGSTPDPICRDYATAAADYYSQDQIQRAGDYEQAGNGKVLVIAAGRKYLLPARQADDRNLAPAPIGERIARYQAVRSEEFKHCMFGMPVNARTLR